LGWCIGPAPPKCLEPNSEKPSHANPFIKFLVLFFFSTILKEKKQLKKSLFGNVKHFKVLFVRIWKHVAYHGRFLVQLKGPFSQLHADLLRPFELKIVFRVTTCSHGPPLIFRPTPSGYYGCPKKLLTLKLGEAGWSMPPLLSEGNFVCLF
jgi:hypothetical protein